MAQTRKAKVVVIPSAQTAFGGRMVEILLRKKDRLALGAPPSHYQILDATLDGCERAYAQPVDLDDPESTNTFFQIAFAQLGQPAVIVLETPFLARRRLTAENAIEIGTRRLLHCMDAALPYTGKDLHFICITPPYGPAAIPIVTAFLAAKCAAGAAPAALPCVRLSVVSPSRARPANDVSFARTVVHLMKEPQSPDITETMLAPQRKHHHSERTAFSKQEEILDTSSNGSAPNLDPACN
ncbi:MAG: hypothetical protein JSR99_17365 [Proteobacteria bacterium]|nr:hypothetical protein [Pseudomonadota bacterium]